MANVSLFGRKDSLSQHTVILVKGSESNLWFSGRSIKYYLCYIIFDVLYCNCIEVSKIHAVIYHNVPVSNGKGLYYQHQ